jgi:hypothetical protein
MNPFENEPFFNQPKYFQVSEPADILTDQESLRGPIGVPVFNFVGSRGKLRPAGQKQKGKNEPFLKMNPF